MLSEAKRLIGAKEHGAQLPSDPRSQVETMSHLSNAWARLIGHHRLDKRIRKENAILLDETPSLSAHAGIAKPESCLKVPKVSLSDLLIERDGARIGHTCFLSAAVALVLSLSQSNRAIRSGTS